MQILLIILIAGLYLDEAISPDLVPRPDVSLWVMASVMVLSLGTIAFGTLGLQIAFRRRLDRSGNWRFVFASDMTASVARVLVVGVHLAGIVWLGSLDSLRTAIGDLILIDELVILSGPVATFVAIWASQYEFSRRVRDASLIREVDEGRPIYAPMSRGQFILAQIRLHFVLLLLPILLVIGWREVVESLQIRQNLPVQPALSELTELASVVAGTGCILLFAPMMVRRLWDTIPLPDGETRQRLLDVCHRHGIRVRELLLWNTFGGMMNGAVMGLIGRVRYILLTDALLDALTPRQVEAVMAHELGHVKRHHLPWLAVVLFASLLVSAMAVGYSLEWIVHFIRPPQPQPTWVEDLAIMFGGDDVQSAEQAMPAWVEPTAIVATFALTFVAFGWVSRRFERQADTFAVQHLSGMTRKGGWSVPISEEATQTMAGTLDLVGALNHIPPGKRSWRHGSIAWRIRHLRSLSGTPCGKVAIDRHIAMIKVVSALILLAGAIFWSIQFIPGGSSGH